MENGGAPRPTGKPVRSVAAASARRAALPGDPGDDASDYTISLAMPGTEQADREKPADKRASKRTMMAQWALWGKEDEDPDYRVLRCSAGPLDRSDFHLIITRYASGAKERLPQYTVCWIPDDTQDKEKRYLAIGIHEFAHADPDRSGGRARTERGRTIEYLRLFCIRYSELAGHRANYTELVEALRDRQLPADSREPIRVELRESRPPLAAPTRPLAVYVAMLLLTTHPVYVLGAERVTAEDRLRFIDRVMSLLPYGLRASLSASTWASATAEELKLRLYFTNARREDDGQTSHVSWSQLVQLDPGQLKDLRQQHYLSWLRHTGSAGVAELADQTSPVGFSADEIRRMIANLPKSRPVRDILEELADGIARHDPHAIGRAVDRLRLHGADRPDPARSQAYRQAIKKLGLLREHRNIDEETSGNIYSALLHLAFDPPVSYGSYCDIELCRGGPPRGRLRDELLKLEFSSFVACVLSSQGEGGVSDQELLAVMHEHEIPAGGLIAELEQHIEIIDPAHRASAYDFAVRYLCAYSDDPRMELAQRRYLTDTLEVVFPHRPREQRIRLEEVLRFIYGGRLSNDQVRELYSQPGLRPTVAFNAAVERLSSPSWHWMPSKIPVWLRRTLQSGVVVKVWMIVIGIAMIATVFILLGVRHG